jgi:hypothetical protein
VKACSVCDLERPNTDYVSREKVCRRCVAISIALVREAYGVPVLNPGDDELQATLELIEKETAEAAKDLGKQPGTFTGYCSHCSRPASAAYMHTCRSGYPAGICEGIVTIHRHQVCPGCGYEEIVT